jgi:ribose transport system substrate-binding protein
MNMQNKKRSVISIVLVLIIAISLAACGGTKQSASNTDTNQNTAQSTSTPAADAQQGADPAVELAKLATAVMTKGPFGEEPVSANNLNITDEDIAKLKEKKVTAAISMHFMGNDYSNTQVSALKEQFGKMGIEVIAVTDANFKPEKQTSDIETILAKKPDILVSIPTDAVAMAPAYMKAAQQGVKIIFMSQAGAGMKPGKDYTSIISADDYGNGVASGYLMARELGGKGKIGVIYHDADFPTTKLRYDGFMDTIKKYPGITVALKQGIAGPDFPGDAEKATSAFLLKEPEIKGIWGVWDVPADGIMAAARNAGRDKDIIITTEDLGKNAAIEIAKGGMIKGTGAQGVYQAGVAEAKAGAMAVLGKEVPPFIVVNAMPVDKSNVLDSWKKIYNSDPPQELVNAIKK